METLGETGQAVLLLMKREDISISREEETSLTSMEEVAEIEIVETLIGIRAVEISIEDLAIYEMIGEKEVVICERREEVTRRESTCLEKSMNDRENKGGETILFLEEAIEGTEEDTKIAEEVAIEGAEVVVGVEETLKMLFLTIILSMSKRQEKQLQ